MDHENTANTALKEQIFQKIVGNTNGAISFAQFMELALYEPELGYYSKAGRLIGRENGDFYTSVSVGKCFGLLLGYAIEAEWDKAGRPADWLIAEQGAHDGQLALDIIEGLQQRKCPLLEILRYVVIDPHAGRRDYLKKRLLEVPLADVVATADGLKAGAGVFLCNELVDAFPVHRIRWEKGKWQELWVTRADSASGFALDPRDIDDPALLAEASRIDTEDFSEGYTTEINLAMRDWLLSVCGVFEQGQGNWWLIDYGHREEDYYSPSRREGTLRCYRLHHASDDALENLGETDITAHVNFSRLADFATEAGLTCDPLQDQHEFLIRAAKPWLLAMEESGTTQEANNKKLLRQFQTLTHPGIMGRAFKVLRLS